MSEVRPTAPASRRRVLLGGGAAALGVTTLALPAVAAASSTFGLTPLEPAGTMDTPADFTATAGDTTVRLTWSAVTGAVAYQVQYKEATSSTWLVDRLTDLTALTVSGLTNGTQYDFRVIASDGTPSNVSTPTSPLSRTPQLTAPGTPVGVSAAPGDPGQLVVTWSAAATGGAVASYSVRYGTDEVNWTEETGIAGTTRTLSGLTNGTEYFIQVQAVNTAGTSSWTSSATGTPIASVTTTIVSPTPQPPAEGAITGPSSVVIETDVDTVGNTERLYTYAVSTDEGTSYSAETTVAVTSGDPTFTITGLTAQTPWIRVRKYEPTGTPGQLGALVATSEVRLLRRTPSYTAGQVYTVTNASGATRIGTLTVTAIGGSGGVGGNDSGTAGGSPSQPIRVEATVTLAAGETLTLAAGSGGAAGAFGGSGGNGGTNAFGGYAGGRGAADGPRGASGTGGGGGAASVVRVGSTDVVIAGGGGGGGGAEAARNAPGANGSSTTTGGQGGTSGANGTVFGGSNDDAGGGGGGGGGAQGGNGGGQSRTGEGSCGVFCTIYYYRSTESRSGTGAVDGTIATAVSNAFASGRANSTSGAVTLEYLDVSDIISVL